MNQHQPNIQQHKKSKLKKLVYIVTFIVVVIFFWAFIPLRLNETTVYDDSTDTNVSELDPRLHDKKSIPKENEALDMDFSLSEEQIAIQNDVKKLSETIIEALNERDMETVALYVDKEKGLLLSPNMVITDKSVVFHQAEVAVLLEQQETYHWGEYDENGTPIELTPQQYLDEFMDLEPLLTPEAIIVEKPENRSNSENNLANIFPHSTIVEVYYEGSEAYGGMDSSSIHLVYEKDKEGIYTLIAIVRDMWTSE